jgi:hypothetical protein
MEKLNRLDSVPSAFINSVEKILPELFGQLMSTVDLDYEGGRVARSRKNMRLILQALDGFQEWLLNPEASPYFQAVSNFMGEFDAQKRLNTALLSSFGAVPTTAEVVYSASRAQAVNLLIGDHMTSRFVGAIRDTLIDSVSSSRTFAEVTKSLSEVVLGNKERNGQLLNWTKQVAHDRFAMTDRAYTVAAAEELNVEWYQYAGGLIEDTREFCQERNGNFYHVSEIQAWPDEEGDWSGRMPNTDADSIFVKCGGYRCQHSLIPVSEFAVPEERRAQFAAQPVEN